MLLSEVERLLRFGKSALAVFRFALRLFADLALKFLLAAFRIFGFTLRLGFRLDALALGFGFRLGTFLRLALFRGKCGKPLLFPALGFGFSLLG